MVDSRLAIPQSDRSRLCIDSVVLLGFVLDERRDGSS